MAQKLNADLNIIQRSGIEVQIDPLTKDLDIIQKLDDEPNDVGGLSAAELKAKFDEAGNIIKTYINDSLIPQVTAETVSEEQRELNEQQRQDNEAQRQANEQVRQENEAARVEAETDRTVWEDYDPAKAYVPGNKVYWAGSSYVNKVPCTGVPPNVAAYWQMIAKRGETVGDGMTEEDCDERYLQLSGGTMTGPLTTTVTAPTVDESPTPKWYVSPESIFVEKLPDRTTYFAGDRFDPSGMRVKAKDKNGGNWEITGYTYDPNSIAPEKNITISYEKNHGSLLTAELPFVTPAGIRLPFIGTDLPISASTLPVYGGGTWVISVSGKNVPYSKDNGKTWLSGSDPSASYRANAVYHDGTWLLPPSATDSSNIINFSKDGAVSWKTAMLPVSQYWNTPAYGGETWIIVPSNSTSATSNKTAYSEDGGETWKQATLPGAARWRVPVYGDGLWVAVPSDTASYMACSHDHGKTWVYIALQNADWNPPVYADGVWSITPSTANIPAVYSEDGGSTWQQTALPAGKVWRTPVYDNGVLLLFQSSGNTVAYSEDGGKTWKQTTLPQNHGWGKPIYADGAWVVAPGLTSSGYSHAAYSEDNGKTWHQATLPVTQNWYDPVYSNGVWFLSPSNGNNVKAQYGAYSEDGGKTWHQSNMQRKQLWYPPVCGGGVLLAAPRSSPSDSSPYASYSEDGGKTWKETTLPYSEGLYMPVYDAAVFILTFYNNQGTNSRAAYADLFFTLAPLPGQEAAPAAMPALPLESQVAALRAENAALAAAIERGLSL